jgi:hypothetical protein
MPDPAPWLSPLGTSAALFVAAGAFQLLIAILTAGFLVSGGGGNALLFTARSDEGAFGKPPRELVQAEPGVDTYRHLVWTLLAGFLAAVGLLEMAVAWFALRSGSAWAAATLSAVAVVLALAWVAILAVYVAKGARVTLGDVPPFMWVPAFLHVPAVALAWWGLQAHG